MNKQFYVTYDTPEYALEYLTDSEAIDRGSVVSVYGPFSTFTAAKKAALGMISDDRKNLEYVRYTINNTLKQDVIDGF